MRFTKMHGLGNDYVYIDGSQEPSLDFARAARLVSDRHFAVGSDGLIAVCPPSSHDADLRMRMFNADGSEGEMCGNGIRCVAK
ncbi:MAG: diaminopimelate epimerase, partial [Planctomycetota bacterium]|nr:diaminopimelate epimerase [Planctomycetota bacterium]